MRRKASLGKNEQEAVAKAQLLNSHYRLELERETARLEAAVDFGSPPFAAMAALDDDDRFVRETAPSCGPASRRTGQIKFSENFLTDFARFA